MKTWILFILSLGGMLGGLWFVMMGLAPEASQGYAQKIFFLHVPSAFAMYLTLGAGAILSIVYLIERKKNLDLAARACMMTATVFATAVLVSGPIWAKPIWGVYWTWDPRLTTSFIIFILLLAYVFVRQIFEERESQTDRGALVGAIISIFALIDIPLIHFSVKLWRGVHPSVLKTEGGLPDDYRLGLEIMIVGIFLFATLMSILLYRFLKIREWHRNRIMKGSPHA